MQNLSRCGVIENRETVKEKIVKTVRTLQKRATEEMHNFAFGCIFSFSVMLCAKRV